VSEILRAFKLTDAKLPLVEVIHFTDGHLTCEMHQKGAEIFLYQFDGTRAVGHWRWDVADIESELEAMP
jgi:hypothetical protein